MNVASNVARTNVQLLNQLIEAGRPEAMLLNVRAACELGNELYSGRYHTDGKAFVSHTIAVASMAARLGLSDDVVAAAVIHSVYCNADFGDGLVNVVTPARRELVCRRVGREVEEIVSRFRELRLRSSGPQVDVDALCARDREIILMDLADHFEKYLDGSLAYYGDCSWIREFDEPNSAALRDLACRLGQREFGDEYVAAIRRQIDWFERVPASLRTPEGQRHGRYIIAPSYSLKLSVRRIQWSRRLTASLRSASRWLRHRFRLRTRLRQWFKGAGEPSTP